MVDPRSSRARTRNQDPRRFLIDGLHLSDAADDPSAPSRRCRKQSQPRKISADDAAVQEVDPAKQGQPTEDDSRVTPYQTKASLILHTVCCAKDIEDIALEDITLYANANSPYQR